MEQNKAYASRQNLKMMLMAGFANLKIQNGELQFVKSVIANRSPQDRFCRWHCPDKYVEFPCQDKLSKIQIACFFDLLFHILDWSDS
jgi:hypothetical protein